MALTAWSARFLSIPSHVWAAALLFVLLSMLAWVTRGVAVPGAWPIERAQVPVQAQGRSDAPLRALPHLWDDGWSAPGRTVTYRLQLPAELQAVADGGTQIGLLMPRAGVRYRVLLNGQLLSAAMWPQRPVYFDAASQAQMVVLPAALLRPVWGDNLIDIELQGERLRIAGLGVVWAGPADTLQARQRWLSWWQVELTWMVAASAFMLGLMAMMVWLRGRERLIGLLAAGLLVLAPRLVLSTPVLLPGPFVFWDFLHKLSFTWYCGLLYLFISELFGFRQGLVRRTVLLMMAVGPVWLLVQAWIGDYDLYRIWTGVIVLVCVLSLGKVIHRARWGLDPGQRLMVVVGVATLVTGLRDYLVVQMGLPGDVDIRWMTAGSLVLMLAMAGVMVRRAGDTLAQTERLNQELARRVAEREAEFHSVYERLREVEHQQVREAERRRITRDMHDGLGSQLVQTLNLVRHAGAGVDAAAVERMLHHALDDLRLTLDSLEPMDGDLPTILGTWRQRIAPALAAAGIELEWQVQEVPPVPGLEASGVMHLFRCLQEIIANVLKHARADRVVVRTWQEGRWVVLSVADNGIGLGGGRDRSLPLTGRGLRNIRLRAGEIGAQVEFLDGRPGTVVSFRFPSA
ncbi:ATP-binding protein [Hydrogenophaga sp.]|uniref:sensor histidine kinase n=1 Tax=Hydrogenophaga sp. TaxID=1904254 RepID=UPI002B567354|nr:ATP-binding protein [Hydrogenophaga sp.]HMP11167.1 hypothetical protein [Hydrogenophaga sp.]